MNDKKHQDLLLSIAQDFYLNKLSVSDLSAKYNVSRYYISKYLDEVVENNLVTIHINTPFARNAKMERKMMTEFSLKNVYIMKEKPDSITNEDILVSFTAKVMQDLIASAHVVGISWGTFLYRVLDAFSQSDQRNLVFTQFVGEASKRRMYTESSSLLQKAASKYNSAVYLTIPAPLYVANDSLRKDLAEEPAIKATLRVAKKMDVVFAHVSTLSAIEAIPSWGENFRAYFPTLKPREVAGVVYGRPFDRQGNYLTQGSDKVFGLSLDDMKKVPHRVGVIESDTKAAAAIGVLRAKAFTDVIMSESSANKIFSMIKTENY